MRLAHFGHFAPVEKAKAKPMGPSKTPRPNHKQPLPPLLLATIAAEMPNNSQIIMNSTMSSVSDFMVGLMGCKRKDGVGGQSGEVRRLCGEVQGGVGRRRGAEGTADAFENCGALGLALGSFLRGG